MPALLGIPNGQSNDERNEWLGFRRERVQYLNANYRDICKFDGPDDPNYVTLKNAVISATQDISKDGMSIVSSQHQINDHPQVSKPL